MIMRTRGLYYGDGTPLKGPIVDVVAWLSKLKDGHPLAVVNVTPETNQYGDPVVSLSIDYQYDATKEIEEEEREKEFQEGRNKSNERRLLKILAEKHGYILSRSGG